MRMDYNVTIGDILAIAVRKAAVDGWQAYKWQSVEGGSIVSGAVIDRKGEDVSDEEIEHMARSAGLLEVIDDAYLARGDWLPEAREFAELLQSAERERCAKYGDRTCNTCLIDFNTDSPDVIEQKIYDYNMRKIAKLQAEGKWPSEFLKTENDKITGDTGIGEQK